MNKAKISLKPYQRFVLTADIGGSTARFGIMGVRNSRSYDIVHKSEMPTGHIKSVSSTINEMLKNAHEQYGITVKMACIGAAGPVPRKRGYIKLTNADVEVNQQEILTNTMLSKVILVNDFEAMGYGIDLLDLERDVIKLPHVGLDLTSSRTGFNTIAVIGVRTGLGMSIAHYDASKHLHQPLPSEGGHIDLVPYNGLETELASYLRKSAVTKEDVHPEMERVLSARGMEGIFEFLAQKDEYKSQTVEKIRSLQGVTKLQEIEGNYHCDKACRMTIDLFMGFYARACRYLALISECYSGLFITDIIALRNIRNMEDNKKILMAFMEMFERHDKRSDVLRKIPVYLITNKEVALYGACNVALNFFGIR